MVTGAGALYYDVDYSTVTPATTAAEFVALLDAAEAEDNMLGGTNGGCTITLTPRIRQKEVDDLLADLPGFTVQEGWEAATIATTAVEMVLKKIEKAMANTQRDATTGALQFVGHLAPQHFTKDITLVTGTSGGKLIVFRLRGSINTAGLTVTTVSGGEASYPIELRGHQPNVAAMRAAIAPLEMFEFDNNGASIEGAFHPALFEQLRKANMDLKKAQDVTETIKLEIEAEVAKAKYENAKKETKATSSTSRNARTEGSLE